MKATDRIRQAARNWALRRQGQDSLPLKLKGRRIYILPTTAGWTFAAMIGVTFIAGMNYGNGLALLLAFWLTGFALIAMVQTQRILAGLVVRSASAAPAFAGEAVSVSLMQESRTPACDLQLKVGGPLQNAPEDAPDDCTVRLAIPVRQRGPWRAPALHISASAPFGLFRTWTWLALDIRTVVYPRPHGALPVPESAGDGSGSRNPAQGLDELAWLRDYREGDSPRQVAWKAYARGAPLLVREYLGERAHHHLFDFSALTGLDTEARLSQLTRWVVDAQAHGELWELRLPGNPPMSGQGEQHRDTCLQALALYGLAAQS